LAIIGVVAAITIPSIVANHQKRTLETQFAKAYRMLQTTVNLAISEHGGIESWDWKDNFTYEERDEFVKKYFTPHLNVAKFCPNDKSVKGCLPDTIYKYLDGSQAKNYATTYRRPQILLADGMSLEFFPLPNCLTNKDRCLGFHIDINGHKKPNTIGLDYFAFNFYPQTGEVLPFGINTTTFNEESGQFEKNNRDDIYTQCTGAKDTSWYCSALIVLDGFKMNY